MAERRAVVDALDAEPAGGPVTGFAPCRADGLLSVSFIPANSLASATYGRVVGTRGGIGTGNLEPDIRGPARYLWWIVRCQRRRVARGTFWGTAWMVGLMLPPWIVSRAIDDGLRPGRPDVLLAWSGVLVLCGALVAVCGLYRHRTMTFVRMDASVRTVRALVRHAVRTGASLPRTVASGEVASVGGTDPRTIAEALTITGPGVGAVIAYAGVATLLLSFSPLLAAVVLLGVPAIALVLGPLLRRMAGTLSAYRSRQGELTARAGDIVAGLRVLAGLGGQRQFRERFHERSGVLLEEGYRVSAVTSWVQALGLGVPALFLVGIVWLGAHMAAAGAITIGQLVAIYGFVAQLLNPVAFLIDGVAAIGRGLVAARRVVMVLSVCPEIGNGDGEPVAGPVAPAPLHDPTSGVTIPPGVLTAVVAADAGDAVAIVDRLGRFAASDVTWGGVPLAMVALPEVRRRVLVADNHAHLFPGPQRATLPASDAEVERVLTAAAAADVVSSLPGGLDGVLDAQGRNLSGGQRQRVRLARALLADPDVLLLVEPTSAVDATTEAAVYRGLLAVRSGRTTVVAGTSPLLLDRAEHVVHVVEGRAVAAGAHDDLLLTSPGYTELVLRDELAEEAGR